ncbi:VOC family protein [Marinicrinis sediminis]|uniref:VOC family protein n=1 Tax=Marinicrinis sediminis TaxID=1652465 RepID=A0ABW5RH21_9BACL
MEALFQHMDTVFIRVKHFERAVQWYESKLKLSVIWRTDLIAAFRAGDKTTITLVQKDVVPDPFPIWNLYTPNIVHAHQVMTENGIKTSPIRDYGTVQMFDFTDVEGHLFNVCHY